MSDNKFEMHCIVELFGHQQIAGKVTEQSIGGATFIRVDVPKTRQRAEFTKFYGPNAIYAITPVNESIAAAMAEALAVAPVQEYRLASVSIPVLTAGDDPGERFFSDDELSEPIEDIVQHDDKSAAATWARELLADEFVVLDTETTGLNKERDDEPVQIAVIDQAGKVQLDTLVKPTFSIPAEATRIHGITDEMVKDAPGFADIQDKLIEVIQGKQVVIYNASFDQQILINAARTASLWGYTASTLCAMTQYAQFYGEWNDYHGSYRWQSLVNACRQQGIEVTDEHSALGDCKLTLALIREMAEYQPGD